MTYANRIQLGEIHAEEVPVRQPFGVLERPVGRVTWPRQHEADAQLTFEALGRLLAVAGLGVIPPHPVARDAEQSVEAAPQPAVPQKAAERLTPAQRLAAVELLEWERDEQALRHVRELVADQEVPQNLEVLDRDRVAPVVVRDHLGLGAHGLALGDALHDRRALVA